MSGYRKYHYFRALSGYRILHHVRVLTGYQILHHFSVSSGYHILHYFRVLSGYQMFHYFNRPKIVFIGSVLYLELSVLSYSDIFSSENIKLLKMTIYTHKQFYF
jgi:hypothetical protein